MREKSENTSKNTLETPINQKFKKRENVVVS